MDEWSSGLTVGFLEGVGSQFALLLSVFAGPNYASLKLTPEFKEHLRARFLKSGKNVMVSDSGATGVGGVAGFGADLYTISYAYFSFAMAFHYYGTRFQHADMTFDGLAL